MHENLPAEYYGGARSNMLPFVPIDAGKILEVGCAEGEFGKAVKSRQTVEYWGIEPLVAAAQVAQTKLDRVFAEPIEAVEAGLPEGYFDCIVCNDVLEHLVDPWAVLRALRGKLRLGGYVVASLPNVRYFEVIDDLLSKAEWRYVEYGVLDRTHMRFFTKKSMQRLFLDCGFEVLRIEGINRKKLPRKFKLANRLFRGAWDDMRYVQFACVARAARPSSLLGS